MVTKTVDVHEAQTRLLELVSQVIAGTEIIITEDDKPLARLVPITTAPLQARVAGLHAGAISTSDDFDVPLSDEFWTGSA
jgi:antitoxin (DNA-binding transcriptional repressor) of toxin-antitoxin stability system